MYKKKNLFNLLVLIPNSGMSYDTLNERKSMLEEYAAESTMITVECISGGPESIESEADEVIAGQYITERAQKAAEDGFDAMIIYCFSDPAIRAARELSPIPVIGPGAVSMMIAQEISNRYSLITVSEKMISICEHKLRTNFIDFTRCASIRSIDISVSDLRENLDETYLALKSTGEKCIREDGADCIVLACLGMAGLGERLGREFGIPVLDPAFISVGYAELMFKNKLNYSL